ncbi:MAG: hypothetical protein ACFB4I_16300 [Cyanophyceae cyanobacterium]
MVESTSGQPFQEYLKRHLFELEGMFINGQR